MKSRLGAITIFGVVVAGVMWWIKRWHQRNLVEHREEVEHLLDIARTDHIPDDRKPDFILFCAAAGLGRELDELRRFGVRRVFFVDDNFIGNRKAAKELLPHLVEWQRHRAFPLTFACEATLNIAKQTEILELMQAASFVNVFIGIETPEVDALKQMRKDHNAALPMMESIRTLNSYGIEITSGLFEATMRLCASATRRPPPTSAWPDRAASPSVRSKTIAIAARR